MLDTRRFFLKTLAGISGAFLLFQSSPPIPKPRVKTPVNPPDGAENHNEEPSSVDAKAAMRAKLQAQEKEFRETMLRLFTKVQDLKEQVDQLNSSDVFSVSIFKQTQEIEKLAKQLKSYAKI